MPAVFAACDLLIHPARYEAYGLARARSALPRPAGARDGTAGVAERYPEDLSQLLLQDPRQRGELTAGCSRWRDDDGSVARARRRVRRRGCASRTWDHMAREIVALAEA